MDRLICASLSHTHYWYEVGMLKVPATYPCLVQGSGESYRRAGTDEPRQCSLGSLFDTMINVRFGTTREVFGRVLLRIGMRSERSFRFLENCVVAVFVCLL